MQKVLKYPAVHFYLPVQRESIENLKKLQGFWRGEKLCYEKKLG